MLEEFNVKLPGESLSPVLHAHAADGERTEQVPNAPVTPAGWSGWVYTYSGFFVVLAITPPFLMSLSPRYVMYLREQRAGCALDLRTLESVHMVHKSW